MTEDEPVLKKRHTTSESTTVPNLTSTSPTPTDPAGSSLKCQFMIPKKNRTCGMQRRKDQKFCSQHMGLGGSDDRIPCPLDPNHTISKENLQRHLKKCNSRQKEQHDPWYVVDLNSKLQGERVGQSRDDNTHDGNLQAPGDLVDELVAELVDELALFKKYIRLLDGYRSTYPPLQYQIHTHKGLDQRMSEVENQKHPLQQASLAGNLKARGQLGSDNFYVEFGCGKAELSRFLNVCILQDHDESHQHESHQHESHQHDSHQHDSHQHDSHQHESHQHESHHKCPNTPSYGFGLIDRGINRMKNDSKIIKETTAFNQTHNCNIQPQLKRTRIDIKHIDLSKFLADLNYDNVIGISKHLCGVATDLTLKLIFNSQLIERNKFKGILIAMCCRHVCDYDQLLPQSQAYLTERGITAQAFPIIKRIVSWAVSGTKSTGSDNDNGSNTEHLTGLDANQRQQLGLIARRLIDESRLYAIKQLLPSSHYECEMFWYVKPETTLENVCLSINRKSDQK